MLIQIQSYDDHENQNLNNFERRIEDNIILANKEIIISFTFLSKVFNLLVSLLVTQNV